MSTDLDERLQAEIELLEAMYPDRVVYNSKSRELRYTSAEGSFLLRLTSGYLHNELPDVLAASTGKADARARLKQDLSALSVGEEVLDSLVAHFNELVSEKMSETEAPSEGQHSGNGHTANDDSKATILVWLHHLLNTNKRKLALFPPSGVSGVTKPGYPGVLIYSGPASLVHEHVSELRQQNWQAFQVRLESEDEWAFGHGKGVKEVESMGEIVAAIGETRKEEFMNAMRMK